MTFYSEQIQKIVPQHDPRHIEAYMRLQYGTLDHLDAAAFRREAKIGAACVEQGGVEDAEDLAKSFGL